MSKQEETKSDTWIKNLHQTQVMRDMLCVQIVFMCGLVANIDTEIAGDDAADIQASDILREIMNKLINPAEVVQ